MKKKIILSMPEEYKINEDSLILAALSEVGLNVKVLDLGAGNGIVGLTLYLRDRAEVYFLEKQDIFLPYIKENAKKIGLENPRIIQADFFDMPIKKEKFEFVIANLPYFDENSGKVSENEVKRQASFLQSPLRDLANNVFDILYYGGIFEFIYPASREKYVLESLKGTGLRLLKKIYIKSIPSKKPYLMFFRFVKGKSPPPIEETLTVKANNKSSYLPWIWKVYELYGF